MSIVGNAVGTVTVTAAIRKGGSFGIDTVNFSITQTGSNPIAPGAVLPAGIAGTLTTRTSGTAGIATLPNALTGSEKIGFFWLDATTGAQKSAYGGSISSHDSGTVTFTGLSGDALPTISGGTTPNPAIVLAVAQTITDLVMPGTNVLQLMISSTQNGLAVLSDVTPTVRYTQFVTPTGPYIYPTYVGQSQPFSQTIVFIDCYNASTTASNMTVEALLV